MDPMQVYLLGEWFFKVLASLVMTTTDSGFDTVFTLYFLITVGAALCIRVIQVRG
eukprot:SAG22_NODE_1092_length_5588_cov_12.400984_3_plen_55_part_00